MAHILYVKGNPKILGDSNTLKLAEHFLDVYRQDHPNDQIEELDLYNGSVPLLDGDVFNGWGKLAKKGELQFEERQKVERLGTLVDQFLAADKLILAAPMWNFGYPPMVKAYLDSIAVAGRTFNYTADGPEGLVGDKKVLVIETRGGIYSEGAGAQMEHSISHLRTFFGLLGITEVEHIVAEALNWQPENALTIMEATYQEAAAAARAF